MLDKPVPDVKREDVPFKFYCIILNNVFDSIKINNELGLVTGRGCCRCEASAHEAVLVHREWTVTKQMW